MDLELNFEKRYRLIREIIETLVLTVLMFLIIQMAIQNFNIDGMSMEPTLHNGELMIVDKWSYAFHAPARGDIIVFVAPPNPSQDYVKRVIGLPGDVISIQNTTISINGKVLREPYIAPENQGNPYSSFVDRVIPANTFFVLGDNRNGSSDSRAWGCVPRGNIIGRGALIYWPFGQNNLGLLPSATSTFENLPAPPTHLPADASTCPVQNGVPASAPVALQSQSQGGIQTGLLLIAPSISVASRRRPTAKAKV
ncbi:hypothetical protein KTT_37700 [Tengunoibacter tsumagoiensis]|uniref:Signal peptidase I n=1 Tax=Tengunoibacter tsumagoiensis TaxID=2014871 RepID=A0A402A4I5_9CHLR|nr:hypothetical protein KTT_37700 [Tengunoibacter tsumagoiensis]